jgi:hypothetical protein
VQDIVSPVKRAGRAYQHYAILLHPTEEGIPSKTQQWDEMLSLDLKRFKFLGPLLISWLNIRSRPKSEPAFSVSLQDVTDFCHDHWSSLGLAPWANSTYIASVMAGPPMRPQGVFEASWASKAEGDGNH